MKSYWLKMDDHHSTLEMRDIAQPTPGPRQVLVRVRAAGLNRGELIAGHPARQRCCGQTHWHGSRRRGGELWRRDHGLQSR